MTILLGTLAHNAHVQNLALALAEVGALARYETGWVYRASEQGAYRTWLRRVLPRIEKELGRRSVEAGIASATRNNPGWEVLRTAAGRLGAPLLADWLHDRATFSLARHCATLIDRGGYTGFVGVEYGALEPLLAADTATAVTSAPGTSAQSTAVSHSGVMASAHQGVSPGVRQGAASR